MKSKDEIFEGKSFQDLTKDIYKNTTDRRTQIDLLISEIHGFIQTIDDVVMVAPIIKEYMDVAVKNDEHLVKLAGVIQRILAKSSGGFSPSPSASEWDGEGALSVSVWIACSPSSAAGAASSVFKFSSAGASSDMIKISNYTN